MRSFLAVLWLTLALSADAATNYILRSATGSATGADWVNAFTNLPATLTRGDVYLIGDGDDYGSYNFNDAVSGSLYIRLQKATPAAHGTDTGWNDSFGDGQAVFRQIQIDRAYHIIDGVTGTSNQARGIKIEHDSTVAGTGGIYMTSTFTDSGEKRQIHLLSLELTQPSGDRHTDASFYLFMNDTNGSWSDPILVVSNCWSHDVGGLNYKHNVGGWFVLVNNYFETCCMTDNASHKELAKWDSTNSHARIYGNVFKDWQGFSVTGGLVIGGEGVDGYMRDWQIFNNLFVWTDRTSPGGVNIWSGGSRAIGGLDSSDTDHDDIHVWNNTFVNITDSTAANIFQNGTWSGVNTVSNNLFVASPGLNAINTTTKGSNAFYQCTSYTPGTHEFTIASDPLSDSGNGEANLASDPGVGMDLSDFFTTDFSGSARPPWTLGAFSFSDSGYTPTIVTNNASGARVMGFRGLGMSVLPIPSVNTTADLWQAFEFTDPTVANLDANDNTSTGTWLTNDNTVLMSISTSGERALRGTINSSSDTGHTRGLRKSHTANDTGNVQFDLAGSATGTISAGTWWKFVGPTPGASKCILLFAYSGGTVAEVLMNTTTKTVGFSGGSNNGVALVTDTWYWITAKIVKNSTSYISVYDTTGTLVGTEVTGTAANQDTRFISLGRGLNETADNSILVYWDDLVLDWTDATYPLGL